MDTDKQAQVDNPSSPHAQLSDIVEPAINVLHVPNTLGFPTPEVGKIANVESEHRTICYEISRDHRQRNTITPGPGNKYELPPAIPPRDVGANPAFHHGDGVFEGGFDFYENMKQSNMPHGIRHPCDDTCINSTLHRLSPNYRTLANGDQVYESRPTGEPYNWYGRYSGARNGASSSYFPSSTPFGCYDPYRPPTHEHNERLEWHSNLINSMTSAGYRVPSNQSFPNGMSFPGSTAHQRMRDGDKVILTQSCNVVNPDGSTSEGSRLFAYYRPSFWRRIF